jgi:cell division transport system permease protein
MRIFFYIKQAFSSMIGRWHQSVVSILFIAIGFLVFGSFLLLVTNLKDLEKQVKGQVQVEVYLMEDITLLQLYLLFDSINGFREVEGVQYRSQKEALAQMEGLLGTGVIEDLEPGTLPASLLLSLKKDHNKFKQVEKLASALRKKEGVEDVEFGAAWLKKADRIASTVFLAMMVLGGIIALALVTVMMSCLRSMARSQAQFIRTMKLLGASISDTSVFMMIQGLLIGGTGALAGVLCLRLISSSFANKVPIVEFLPESFIFALIGWGMIWGMFGILLSARKQLQV